LGCCSGHSLGEKRPVAASALGTVTKEPDPVSRAIDILSVFLLLFAGVAFSLGVVSLDRREDLQALYWLGVGALLLKASVEMLRPGRGGRT
jgi:hypothetical protein